MSAVPGGWIRYVLRMTPIGGIGHWSVARRRRGPWVGLSDGDGYAEPTTKRLMARAAVLMKRRRYREGAQVTAGPWRRWPRRSRS